MIIMKYKGYIIEAEYGHYKVTGPSGSIWRTDTITEAKQDIDWQGVFDKAMESNERRVQG